MEEAQIPNSKFSIQKSIKIQSTNYSKNSQQNGSWKTYISRLASLCIGHTDTKFQLPMVTQKNIKTMKNFRKGGRPKLNQEVKKSHMISVRISENDLREIETKARLASKSVSEFLRESAFKAVIKAAISAEEMILIRRKNNIDFSVANNINQLARKANEKGYSDEIHRDALNIYKQINITK